VPESRKYLDGLTDRPKPFYAYASQRLLNCAAKVLG